MRLENAIARLLGESPARRAPGGRNHRPEHYDGDGGIDEQNPVDAQFEGERVWKRSRTERISLRDCTLINNRIAESEPAMDFLLDTVGYPVEEVLALAEDNPNLYDYIVERGTR